MDQTRQAESNYAYAKNNGIYTSPNSRGSVLPNIRSLFHRNTSVIPRSLVLDSNPEPSAELLIGLYEDRRNKAENHTIEISCDPITNQIDKDSVRPVSSVKDEIGYLEYHEQLRCGTLETFQENLHYFQTNYNEDNKFSMKENADPRNSHLFIEGRVNLYEQSCQEPVQKAPAMNKLVQESALIKAKRGRPRADLINILMQTGSAESNSAAIKMPYLQQDISKRKISPST